MIAKVMISLAEVKQKQGDLQNAKVLYKQALRIAQQYDLPHTKCEALIGMAELWSSIDKVQAKQSSREAVILAESIQSSQLLERANVLDHYLNL